MANSNVAMYIQTIQGWPLQLNNASSTTPAALIIAGANGSRVTSIMATSTDTASRDIQLSILRSGTAYILGTVNIPIGSGNSNSVPSVNVLGSAQLPGVAFDANGNPYIDLKAADVLQVGMLVAITSGKLVNVIGYGGDF